MKWETHIFAGVLLGLIWLSGPGYILHAADAPFATQQLSFEASIMELEALREIKRSEISQAYTDQLNKVAEQAQDQGNLDATVAVQTELERFKKSGSFTPDAKAPSNERPGWLLRVQAPFQQQADLLDRAFLTQAEKKRDAYLSQLESMKITLTQARKYEEAVEIQKEKIRVGSLKMVVQAKAVKATPKTVPPESNTVKHPAPTTINNQAYALDAALREGLVFHYSFDQKPTTDTIPDQSGTDRHATASNTRWEADGLFGGCVRLENSDAHITTPTEELGLRGGLTLSIYFSPSIRLEDKQASLIANTEQSGVGLHLYEQSTPGFAVRIGKRYMVVKSDYTAEKEKWHQATAVLRAGSMRIYINGELQKTRTERRRPVEGKYPFIIGANPNRGGETEMSFRGRLDEAMCWNRALSDEEVKMLYRPVP